jgi:hypothetical protein
MVDSFLFLLYKNSFVVVVDDVPVVDGALVDTVCYAGTTAVICDETPVDDNGIVVDGTAVVGRGVVPVVIIVVVGTTHAIIPTVT